ncbi:MAG: hypothetical protein CVU50_01670 [Candidatus Cloacimonetes bacterium HGW-Cloacimonetes-3]|jgi:hypothetical protein|nr:MAG: hypothetical protein CVU50_01670 [Candidatus Cloacimonetes bacterium HGW-Cloacimonetes-3]
MRSTLVFCLILFAIVTSLRATTESEPNNTPGAVGVVWCENGQHNGAFSYTGDLDYWYFYGFPGDTVTVSTMGLTTLDTIIEIRKESGVILASNDNYGGTNQSLVTYTTGNDEIYYVLFREKYSQTGSYGFQIAGEFLSYNSAPEAPLNFNVSNGATGVSPYISTISWNWGDGSYGGDWVFNFGISPESMVPLNDTPIEIRNRNGSIELPDALMGGFTYFFIIDFNGMLGYPGSMPVYSFTTAPLHLPVPFTENFNTPDYMFACTTPGAPWMNASPEEGNPGAMMSIAMPGVTSILMEKGCHNLVGTTGAYLTFRHIALMEPEDDHAYVEYSADGGTTWSIFPVSAYLGTGNYRLPTGNNPEGPCFDAGSYEGWADYETFSSTTGYWQTETFDLTPWAGSANFRVRFRSVYDEEEIGLGWIVDDFIIQATAITVPDAPQNLSVNLVGTEILLQWSAVEGISDYRVYSSTDPNGTFLEDFSGVYNANSWTAPTNAERLFYRVVSVTN